MGGAVSAVASILGGVLSGGVSKSPSPPPPIQAPPPPPPPKDEKGKSADEAISEQGAKNRAQKRRKTNTRPSVTSLASSTDKKSLLGD